ncbi:helix-turn-helix transcriptional regulator, partial [Roseospira visakhapatnamensis]
CCDQTVPVMSREKTTGAAGWRGDYLALHALIRRRRNALRLTQAEAGAAIGLSERSYRDIEAGRRDIGAEALFRLCAALNLRLVPAENRQDLAGFEEP